MSQELKPIVSKEESFDKLEIRVGRVIHVELEPSTLKPSYRMVIDFGRFGKRVSVGRFTQHPIEEVKGRLILAVLNFEPRTIGNTLSEALVLGVQFPKAESGEATFVSPAASAKIGSRLF
ncbi:MAG: tRNA-binding protein [Deltaproteobacteria bacterium]|jgi:tRNA-binding protein|nr:tRNA-binding protein [Deltaproteobacteria bacterium]